MIFDLFENLKNSNKCEAVSRLIAMSLPKKDFFLLVIASVLMASFGLILENTAVVIGSMLIAPVLYPILSFSMGVSMLNGKLIQNSFYTVLKSIVFSLIIATLVSAFVPGSVDFVSNQLFANMSPSWLYLIVAFTAGFSVSYSLVKPELSATLPGVAVSVSLIPPLSAIGIGMGQLNWEIVRASSLLFLINILGIILSAVLVFSLMSMHKECKVADKAIKEGEKIIEKENEKK